MQQKPDRWRAEHVGIRSQLMRDYLPRKCLKIPCQKNFMRWIDCMPPFSVPQTCSTPLLYPLGQNFVRYDKDRTFKGNVPSYRS